MVRRRDFLALAAVGLIVPISVRAQSLGLPLVGFLGNTPDGLDWFNDGLADAGWLPGDNVLVEPRFAEGRLDLLSQGADELVALAPDVLYGLAPSAVRALAERTATIPIVFSNVGDTVGLVENHARPEGNITGINWDVAAATAKLVETLLIAVPSIERIGFIHNPDNVSRYSSDSFLQGVLALRREPTWLEVSDTSDYERVVSDFATAPNSGLVISGEVYHWTHRETLVDVINRYRVPTIYPFREYVDVGGLLTYTVDVWDPIRLAGAYVGRILSGATPADLPVIVSNSTFTVLNQIQAQELGIEFPLELIALADEIIE